MRIRLRHWLGAATLAGWLAAHAWLWTVLPPVPRWTLPGSVPHSFAFTPDGRSLATCDRAEVGVWDAATGHRVRSWPRPGLRPRRDDFRSLLVMSPTDRRVIVYDTSSGSREKPYLIDLDTGQAAALPAWEYIITADDPCIGFLPDGRTAWQLDVVMKPRMDVVMRLWELPGGPVRQVPIEWRLNNDLSFSADGRRAAANLHSYHYRPGTGTVLILDLAAGRVIHKLTFDRLVRGAVLAPDGRTLAVSACPVYEGGAQGVTEVELWDAESGRRIDPVGVGFAPGWNAAGRLVVLDGWSGVQRTQGPDRAEVVRWPIPLDHFPYSAKLTADGRFLLNGHYQQLPAPLRWLFERLPGRPFDPDKETFVHTVHDAQTGRALAAIGRDAPGTVALAADGTALAVAGPNGLRVWDVPPRRPGGIVLALMTAEVGLLTAWTAWRRRRRRARPGVQP